MTQCPRCGKQTELLLIAPQEESAVPQKAIVWTVVTIVFLAAGVIALVAGLKHLEKLAARQRDRAAAGVSTGAPEAAVSAGFEVSAISLEKGDAGNYAVGTVVNKSNRQRSGVTVELDLFDAGGQKVGIARNYRPALAPGAKWQFRVSVGDAKAVSARLASIKEGQ
jgi:hypothetical protein